LLSASFARTTSYPESLGEGAYAFDVELLNQGFQNLAAALEGLKDALLKWLSPVPRLGQDQI
jgi:hypothetical protein